MYQFPSNQCDLRHPLMRCLIVIARATHESKRICAVFRATHLCYLVIICHSLFVSNVSVSPSSLRKYANYLRGLYGVLE